MNRETNYYKYYRNDPEFHSKVMRLENKEPYRFKIHFFKMDRENGQITPEDEINLSQELDTLGVKRPKFTTMDNKLRVLFQIEDTEEAVKLYERFMRQPYIIKGDDKIQIYLQFPGIFT